MALRAAIPLFDICLAVVSGLMINDNKIATFKATLHEDNQGALALAELEKGRTTPRSKFYALKYHWFKSWLKPGEIEFVYIDTKLQKADFLTKGLTKDNFETNRKLSCGW